MTLLVAAATDLESIRLFTEDRWGVDQAVRYLRALEGKATMLLDYPFLGSPYGGRRVNLRSIKSGQHRIIYDVSDTTITIVRVLHVKMDFHRHLI